MSKTATQPAPPEKVVAQVKTKTKEEIAAEQAKSDAAAEQAFKEKATKEKKVAGPRTGTAPGGVTWVDWFRTQFTKGVDPKAAEAHYFELRKNEPAYAGDAGEKKLKRHAYHHRVLAQKPKNSAAA